MYRIIFNDGDIWLGSEPEQSNWKQMPNKPIKKIEYTLFNKKAIFEGYESYNHLVERTCFIFNNNKEKINKVFLMARKKDSVYCFVFDLFAKEVYPSTYIFGKEYYGKPTSGWKEGLKDSSTYYNLI